MYNIGIDLGGTKMAAGVVDVYKRQCNLCCCAVIGFSRIKSFLGEDL